MSLCRDSSLEKKAVAVLLPALCMCMLRGTPKTAKETGRLSSESQVDCTPYGVHPMATCFGSLPACCTCSCSGFTCRRGALRVGLAVLRGRPWSSSRPGGSRGGIARGQGSCVRSGAWGTCSARPQRGCCHMLHQDAARGTWPAVRGTQSEVSSNTLWVNSSWRPQSRCVTCKDVSMHGRGHQSTT